MPFAITRYPTPVFNTFDLAAHFGGKDGMTLAFDDKKLLRCVETILFPHSKVQLLKQVEQTPIWEISTMEYPYKGPLYIHIRFVELREKEPKDRRITVPTQISIQKALAKMPPCSYVWGGNWPNGIELLAQLYPSTVPFSQLDSHTQTTWALKGVDCSGLLYYLTNGHTPRNTSSLIQFGKIVSIEGKKAEEIAECIQPLDLLVWKGHVVCVMNKKTLIESRHPQGLVRSDAIERLSEIMKDRKPRDAWEDGLHFVVRRWHPEIIS